MQSVASPLRPPDNFNDPDDSKPTESFRCRNPLRHGLHVLIGLLTVHARTTAAAVSCKRKKCRTLFRHFFFFVFRVVNPSNSKICSKAWSKSTRNQSWGVIFRRVFVLRQRSFLAPAVLCSAVQLTATKRGFCARPPTHPPTVVLNTPTHSFALLPTLPPTVQANKWAWQNKRGSEDPLVAWKKMKEAGKIDDIYDVRLKYKRPGRPLISVAAAEGEGRGWGRRFCRKSRPGEEPRVGRCLTRTAPAVHLEAADMCHLKSNSLGDAFVFFVSFWGPP